MDPWHNAKGVMIAASIADLHGDNLSGTAICSTSNNAD